MSSFIANVNKVADSLGAIIAVNKTFTDPEDVATLLDLARTDIVALSEDIAKGTYFGEKKIEIDLFKNYLNYSSDLTKNELEDLFNDINNSVIYDSITFTLWDNSSKTYNFVNLQNTSIAADVTTSAELFSQLSNIIEDENDTFIKRTQINTLPDDNTVLKVVLHSTAFDASNVAHVTVNVKSGTDNEAKAKVVSPTYVWIDYTSILAIVAVNLDNLLAIYNRLDDLTNSEELLADITDKAEELENLYNSIIAAKNQIDTNIETLSNISIGTVDTLAYTEDATVTYNAATGELDFGLPVGAPGAGLTVDATDTFLNRSLYDDEALGFSFVASDTGLMYIKNSSTSGDWGAAINFTQGVQGPQGPEGPKGESGEDGATYGLATSDTLGVVYASTDLEAETGTKTDRFISPFQLFKSYLRSIAAMIVAHKDIVDEFLHEPKGIVSASAGTVYTANGTGSGTWQALPVATTSIAGIARQATDAEASAGTDTTRFVTPYQLKLYGGNAAETYRLSRIGVPVPVASTTLDDSFKFADGSLVLFVDYPELEAKYDAGELLVLAATATATQQTKKPLYFVLNSAGTGLYLPRLGGLFARAWTGEDDGTAGGYNEAGLPNITGVFGSHNNNWPFINAGGYFTGAFYNATSHNSANELYYTGIPDGDEVLRAGFDAQRCNDIYGNATTVMPASYNQPIAIYLGTPTTTE